MLDLIIDTSTATCSIALFDDDKLISSYHEFIGRGHAEILIPEVANVLGEKIPNQIYVNIGPGSFTGIRIGISAARALGLAWSIPCHGYSTMQLIAAQALKQIKNVDERETRIAVDIIMTGGHGQYYMQSFDRNGNENSIIASLTPEQCLLNCKAPYKAGDQANNIDNESKYININTPDTRLFHDLLPYKKLVVSPLYVRPPDAQITS